MGDVWRRRVSRASLITQPWRTTESRTPSGPQAPILDLQRRAGNEAVAAAFDAAQSVLFFASHALDGFEDVLPFELWFALKSRVVFAMEDLDILEFDIETARLEAEARRLKAETAAIRAETDRCSTTRLATRAADRRNASASWPRSPVASTMAWS